MITGTCSFVASIFDNSSQLIILTKLQAPVIAIGLNKYSLLDLWNFFGFFIQSA